MQETKADKKQIKKVSWADVDNVSSAMDQVITLNKMIYDYLDEMNDAYSAINKKSGQFELAAFIYEFKRDYPKLSILNGQVEDIARKQGKLIENYISQLTAKGSKDSSNHEK
ncbi:hypothetical protein WR164_13710 [Philodulcilactobacillus myokoensis]|uniref:Uncharacterized protein n=1 Tax=Philodulcilactobacillus myokoensis TaxID=2929573 RepID=A0A9W6ETH5_9LACO|nr:hypothetical protein [Philodulcilactobacillus myokoensis]GLB47392.1 hypothetical protein WR164_13710 [Philodulcilactobacillus myokoensis]